MTTTPKLARNPIEGDENMMVCITRQTNRKVPLAVAEQVCTILSTVAGSNALKDADVVLVPAIFTAEGVHNGRLKPWSAIKNAAPTLMGVPFFINQPGEHDDGYVPPVDDKKTHHGFVAQVNVDEENKRLTGLIALYTVDWLVANGFSKARVDFQRTLLEATAKGGRFAISTSFLARVRKTSGYFGNRFYSGIEERLIFNGLSIVPLGAEKTALMNGLPSEAPGTKESEFEVIEQGFNAGFPDDSIESLNSPDGEQGPKRMDEAALRNMSIPALGALNTEVARLANEHKQAVADLATANRKLTESEQTIQALQGDAEKTGQVLANLLSKDQEKVQEILANAESNLILAQRVEKGVTALSNDLKERKEKDASLLTKRVEKAEKTLLANGWDAKALSPFKDGKDLEATANRLESLLTRGTTRRVVPSAEVIPGHNVSEEGGLEDDDMDLEKPVANSFTPEYQGLLDLYELPGANKEASAGANKRRKAPAPTEEVDA